MGRGQLKYRKRGGRGRGPSSGGRGQAGRGGTGIADGGPANRTTSRRGGGGNRDISHLPSNTERWGLSFGVEHQGQRGGRTAPASSSAVSFEETERLLDESEWATGASSWRLGAAAAAWDEDQIEGAAVASSELLSLNLDMLEKCLRRSSIHERLRLPHTYTAELEADIQEDPALEPADSSSSKEIERAGAEAARTGRVGGGGGGGGEGETREQAGKAAGAPAKAREGRARGDGDSGGGGGAAAPATVEGEEDGVLDALLGLPAAGAGAGEISSRAGEPCLNAPLSPTFSLVGDETTARPEMRGDGGHGGDRREDGVYTEPAGAARFRNGGGSLGTDVGAGSGGSACGGDADELEDWLDDMLADA